MLTTCALPRLQINVARSGAYGVLHLRPHLYTRPASSSSVTIGRSLHCREILNSVFLHRENMQCRLTSKHCKVNSFIIMWTKHPARNLCGYLTKTPLRNTSSFRVIADKAGTFSLFKTPVTTLLDSLRHFYTTNY